MTNQQNTTYSNSSLLFKILAIACIPAMAFTILNYVLVEFMELTPKSWILELNLILQNGLPFFLFMTGSFIHNKKLRIPLLIFFPIFFIGYTLKTLDFYGFVDLHTKWIIVPSLVGLMITYIIHFFSKSKKLLLDFLKLAWFIMIGYTLLSLYFHIGYKVVYIFEASFFVMLIIMTIGLIKFFRK
ncbi:hypothetical protein BH09BAC5_BH09BAC5_14780 [soil metagenome]